MTNINSITTIPSGTAAGTAAETVVATTPVLNVGAQQPAGVLVRGFLVVSPGTAATAITIRCRQGSITGAQLTPLSFQVQCIASDPIAIPFSFQDTTTVPEQAGGVQYVITTQPNGTGASTAAGQVTVEV
jgi:hypothetical protein